MRQHLVGRRLEAEPGIESPEALRFIQLILQPAHSTLAPMHRDTFTSNNQRLIFFLRYFIQQFFTQIRMFLDLLDPDPEFICTDPDPSINKHKNEEKP
jgi:hypothetical protein